jgi:hypothetical protein
MQFYVVSTEFKIRICTGMVWSFCPPGRWDGQVLLSTWTLGWSGLTVRLDIGMVGSYCPPGRWDGQVFLSAWSSTCLNSGMREQILMKFGANLMSFEASQNL